MTQFVFIATILWIYFISINSSYYILSNNKNIRIVSLSSNCNSGRVEFYNGTTWGTLTTCTKTFHSTNINIQQICQSLGFDFDNGNWQGSNKYNKNIPLISPIITYTTITDCDLTKEDNICAQCLFTKNITTCNLDNNIHNNYDIYISCATSSTYECIPIETYDNTIYNLESCSSMHFSTDNNNRKVLWLTILAIAIFGSIFCVIIFTTYSKYQDSRRLNKIGTNEKNNYDTRRGFATVPGQEVQLVNTNRKTKDTAKYAPPPKDRFIYQERQIKSEYIDRESDMKHCNDMDMEYNHDEISNNNISGYNMEEIIPSVSIIYNKNKSASESYARVTNMDEDEDDDIIIQYEQSKS
eukprot:302833_1